jgi:RNA polymerase sigma factor (sigma-70 family)
MIQEQIQKINEVELLTMLRNNERAGYEYLYNHYSVALYGAIKRIVQNEETSADVLQDVFVKIWRNIARYDEKKGTLFTWMLNISRNESIDKMRSKAANIDKKKTSMEVCKSELKFMSGIDNVKQLYIGISDFVEKLNHNEKFLINLVYFEGYTHSEIALEYGIPLGTVKSRLKRATYNLKNILVE